MYVADYIRRISSSTPMRRRCDVEPSDRRAVTMVTEGEYYRPPRRAERATRGRAARGSLRGSRREPSAGRSARRDRRAAAGPQMVESAETVRPSPYSGPSRPCWHEDRRHRARAHRPASGRAVRIEWHDVTGSTSTSGSSRRSTAVRRRTPMRRRCRRVPRLVAEGSLRADVGGPSGSRAEAVVMIVPVVVDERREIDFGRSTRPRATSPPTSRRTRSWSTNDAARRHDPDRFGPMLTAAIGLELDRDLFLAFSPERVLVGRVILDLQRYPKIVGGTSPESTRRAVDSIGPSSTRGPRSGPWPMPRPRR